jgi:hypothetical protein
MALRRRDDEARHERVIAQARTDRAGKYWKSIVELQRKCSVRLDSLLSRVSISDKLDFGDYRFT